MSVLLSGGERVEEEVSEVVGVLIGQSGRSQVIPAVWCRGLRAVVWGYKEGGGLPVGSNHVGRWRVGVVVCEREWRRKCDRRRSHMWA